ncbi:hypothetical protein P7K49_014946 [Saguinus oedipus]|uniref:Uncharacterized protein n=1 Tax=Saguinus oedipus TaxID=9490 RepID=A0ABQ9V868_SAGOE|nr:hypothetical protein P7K49_014946 [Saguinus oedipus]
MRPFSKTALEETIPWNWFRDYALVCFSAQEIAEELITEMKDLVLKNPDCLWANGKRKAQELGTAAWEKQNQAKASTGPWDMAAETEADPKATRQHPEAQTGNEDISTLLGRVGKASHYMGSNSKARRRLRRFNLRDHKVT